MTASTENLVGQRAVGDSATGMPLLHRLIFVALLKICHVRPLRRRLILETEFKP